MYISDLKATINPRIKFIRVYNLPNTLVQIIELNDFFTIIANTIFYTSDDVTREIEDPNDSTKTISIEDEQVLVLADQTLRVSYRIG